MNNLYLIKNKGKTFYSNNKTYIEYYLKNRFFINSF